MKASSEANDYCTQKLSQNTLPQMTIIRVYADSVAVDQSELTADEDMSPLH